jgi:hypothetical protein
VAVIVLLVFVVVVVAKPRQMHVRTRVVLGCISDAVRMGCRRQLTGDETDKQQK